MVSARADILIARPPEAAFDFIAVNFARNYRRWSPEVERIELLTPGPVRVGTRARQVRVDQGRRTESTFKVVAFQPPDRVAFAERANQFQITYQLDPASQHTRLTFLFELTHLDLFMRPFEKLIRTTVQDGAERVVRNLKGLIELEVPG